MFVLNYSKNKNKMLLKRSFIINRYKYKMEYFKKKISIFNYLVYFFFVIDLKF